MSSWNTNSISFSGLLDDIRIYNRVLTNQEIDSLYRENTISNEIPIFDRYQVFNNWLNWDEAKTYCESIGGHLATITSVSEQNYISAILNNSSSLKYYWLGGTDEQVEGNWKWITGEKWEYSNWGKGEPNNGTIAIENYLVYFNTSLDGNVSVIKGSWNDLPKSSYSNQTPSFGFICEREEIGLFHISPNIANSIEKTLDISVNAYPITAQSRIAIVNGKTIIKSDSILEINKFSLKARFSWENKPSGLYDMIVISPENDTLRLEKCFTIQDIETSLKKGLVAYYPFNGNANDESGNGNNGIVTGATLTTDILGINNSAYYFDGANDFIRIKRTIEDDFTLCGWINTSYSLNGTGFYDGRGLIYADVAGVHNDFGASILNGKFAFGLGNPDVTIQSTTSVNTGKWVFFTAVRNKSDGKIRVYLNGSEETNIISNNRNSLNSPSFINIGGNTIDGRYFNGIIDDIRIYNRVLNDSEIEYLYQIPQDTSGIFNVSPKIAVSYEKSTEIDVSAYPISQGSRVELVRGNTIIKSDSILEVNKFSLKARFSWDNKPLGLYDMILISPANDTMRLEKCFSLQEVGTKFGEWTKVEIPSGKQRFLRFRVPNVSGFMPF
jgi:hypothetical protein